MFILGSTLSMALEPLQMQEGDLEIGLASFHAHGLYVIFFMDIGVCQEPK